MASNLITTVSTASWRTTQLSSEVRRVANKRMRFRQFAKPEPNFKSHMGDELKFPKVKKLQGEGRVIGEIDNIPTGTFDTNYGIVKAEEHSFAVNFTQRASFLSQLNLEVTIIKELVRHAAEYHDKLAANKFLQADLVYTPTGTLTNKLATITTNGVAGAVSTRPISCWDVKNIKDMMRDDYSIPGFKGSDYYVCICRSAGSRAIKDDQEYTSIAKYAYPERVLAGEIGEYYGIRFIEENNVLKNVLPGGASQMVFFGDDPVMELEIMGIQLQAAISESYGRFRGLRWVSYCGYEKTYDYGSDGVARILRVDSLPQ